MYVQFRHKAILSMLKNKIKCLWAMFWLYICESDYACVWYTINTVFVRKIIRLRIYACVNEHENIATVKSTYMYRSVNMWVWKYMHVLKVKCVYSVYIYKYSVHYMYFILFFLNNLLYFHVIGVLCKTLCKLVIVPFMDLFTDNCPYHAVCIQIY